MMITQTLIQKFFENRCAAVEAGHGGHNPGKHPTLMKDGPLTKRAAHAVIKYRHQRDKIHIYIQDQARSTMAYDRAKPNLLLVLPEYLENRKSLQVTDKQTYVFTKSKIIKET